MLHKDFKKSKELIGYVDLIWDNYSLPTILKFREKDKDLKKKDNEPFHSVINKIDYDENSLNDAPIDFYYTTTPIY